MKTCLQFVASARRCVFRWQLSHSIAMSLQVFSVLAASCSPVAAQEAFTGTGTATAGPCSGAQTFIDSAGHRFEIDSSRAVLPRDVPLRIEGRVFRRISVCKVYPWLDVINSRVGMGSASPVARGSDEQKEVGALTITVTQAELIELADWLPSFAARGNVSKVYVQIPDGGVAGSLTQMLLSLGTGGPAVMNKVDFKIGMGATPAFSWRGADKTYTFQSLKDVKYAMSIN
jgi:hypothetical protein